MKVTKEFLQQMDELFACRKNGILQKKDDLYITGMKYYVSSSGNDENDGKSPDKPWKTLEKVSNAYLLPGDGVLFKRGDLFRGSVVAKEVVTYGAYGIGEKPKFYGWDENLADLALWLEVDSVHHIWKYKKQILDAGTLVFNQGEFNSRKLIPSYRDQKFV